MLPLLFAGISLFGYISLLLLLGLARLLVSRFLSRSADVLFFQNIFLGCDGIFDVVWRTCFFIYHVGLACPADD